jgi:hypothetical protein
LTVFFSPTVPRAHRFPAHPAIEAQLVGDLPFVGKVERIGGLFAMGAFPLIAIFVDAVGVREGFDDIARRIDRDQIEQPRVVLHIEQGGGGIAAEILVDMGEIIAQRDVMRGRSHAEAMGGMGVAHELLHRQGEAAQAAHDDQAIAVLIGRVEDLTAIGVAQLQRAGARRLSQQAGVGGQQARRALQRVGIDAVALRVESL